MAAQKPVRTADPATDAARTERQNPTASQLITIQAAAERLGVGNQTVRDFVSRGQLPAYRIGGRILRVDAADVAALVRPVPVGAVG